VNFPLFCLNGRHGRARTVATAALVLLASAPATAEVLRTDVRPSCVNTTTVRVTCADIDLIGRQMLESVALPYQRDDFNALDTALALWRDGGRQFADGSWELALFLPGLEEGLTTVTQDTAKLAAWRRAKPDSAAAQLAEAWVWYVHARRVKGRDPHAAIPAEAQSIARERLARASAVLARLRKTLDDSPVWHEMKIALLVEQGALPAARRVFDDAVKRFPRYHPLYLRMSRAYTGAAFDQFAHEAARLTEKFEGQGQYARLYLAVDSPMQMPFDPRLPMPAWDSLRAAYDDLMQRYPASVRIATSYASVACRSHDSELYRRMRAKADAYLVAAAFNVVPLEICDRRHGWGTAR